MRTYSSILILIVIALAIPPSYAFAQRSHRFSAGRETHEPPNWRPPRHPPKNGSHGSRHRPGRRPTGIIVRIPSHPVVVEKPPRARRRHTPHHRVTRHTPHRPARRAAHQPPQHTVQRRPSGVPPAGEHRYVPDEVLIEVANSTSTATINALQRRHQLRQIERRRLELAGTTFYLWRIPDRRSVPTVVRALERERGVLSAQPNYLFALQQTDAKRTASDPAQYAVAKLRLLQAHVLAKGKGVRVAVINSAVDTVSPELAGSISATFDALAGPMQPHQHGTAIAGLIAGHGKLIGVAPEARILAVRAFDPAGGAGAQGTTLNVLKGLDWAVEHRARIVNMSFAGPPDPAFHRSLANAHAKGVVLVAAAGNGGAKSPPLYPAADPNVIAVTATDADDGLLPQANRGRYIDVAAPGAQVLVAVPGGYEVSSGTSYSAAEVSGVVALLLQRKPRVSPDTLRRLLEESARDLGPKGRDNLFGAGLVDALGAVLAERPITATTLPGH